MKTYCPLWSSILDSTIWSESKDVRILWITMLAMKDANGLVEASLVGLSRRAALTFEETRAAMEVLESPDAKSDRNQEHEGRRVKRVENGWLVLNHQKYRDMISKERQRRQQAEWQRQYRQRKKQKPMTGEIAHDKLDREGASPEDLHRHVDSFSEKPAHPED